MIPKFETREPNEDALTASLIDILRRKMARDYQAGATKRDAHPKHLGLLKATFTIEPQLPAELSVGLFSKAGTYDAWVRSSNASGTPQSDAIKDIRGFAIKLLDVPGDKIPESDEPRTQDFLMISHPLMPVGTIQLFHDLVYYSIEKTPLHFLAKMLLTRRFDVLKGLVVARLQPTSPLDIRYWSTTPYLFGADRAVKFSVIPTSRYRSRLPDKPSSTYLSDNLEKHLAEYDATFDFVVQFQKDAASMPIEDASIEWKESASPFRKVATLTIPKQTFRTAERNELAEVLSFSPWHAGVEHRPLGSINRARLRVYKALSDFRHERDQRRVLNT